MDNSGTKKGGTTILVCDLYQILITIKLHKDIPWGVQEFFGKKMIKGAKRRS